MEAFKRWALVEADLKRARDMLPADTSRSRLDLFQEFLDHNELELAADTLEDCAENRNMSREFWLVLRDAAEKMELRENSTRYAKYAEQAASRSSS